MPKHTITFETFVPVRSTCVFEADTPFEAACAVLDDVSETYGTGAMLATAIKRVTEWGEARDPAIISIIGADDVDFLDGNNKFLRVHTSSTFNPVEDRFFNHDEFRLEFDAVIAGVHEPQADDTVTEPPAGSVPDPATFMALSMEEQCREMISSSGKPIQVEAFDFAENCLASMVKIFAPLGQSKADCGFATISAAAKALLRIDEATTIRALRVIARALEMDASEPDADAEEIRAGLDFVADEMNEVDTMFKLAIQRLAAQDNPTTN